MIEQPRRQFLAALIAVALSSAAAIPVAAETSASRAEQFVNELAADGIRLLTEDGLTHVDRVDRVRNLMSVYFNIEAIGRWVLGRHWRRASAAQRQEYLGLFEDWVVLG